MIPKNKNILQQQMININQRLILIENSDNETKEKDRSLSEDKILKVLAGLETEEINNLKKDLQGQAEKIAYISESFLRTKEVFKKEISESTEEDEVLVTKNKNEEHDNVTQIEIQEKNHHPSEHLKNKSKIKRIFQWKFKKNNEENKDALSDESKLLEEAKASLNDESIEKTNEVLELNESEISNQEDALNQTDDKIDEAEKNEQ
ncbi:hypothetical protein [Enterococcus sp. AZ103]|uniref:hypothetical protein n=1 Tax=Enterococcus sp. AZ103 TaxID=2774628 RepID=UPI003F2861EF